MWFPLGYHPVWFDALQYAMRRFERHEDFGILLRLAFGKGYVHTPIRIAWKNFLPNLSRKLLQDLERA